MVAFIPLLSAIYEFQKQGISLADIIKTNTMASSTWVNLCKLFDLILELIGVEGHCEHNQTEFEADELTTDNLIDLATQKTKLAGSFA